MSARSMLRAFQLVRAACPDESLTADLAYVQHKDLDHSVRLSGLLAVDALLITAAINPIAASPGAPLSVDAATQPWYVLFVCIGLLPLFVAAWQCVRALLIGEEFSSEGIEEGAAAIRQRLFAAYCISVDLQAAVIKSAVRLTTIGGVLTVTAWGVILVDKIF